MPDDSQEQLQFDVERYVRLSKKVDISDLDLSQAAHYPISDEEVRALTYMTDIESHTIVYLRAILNTCAVEDPHHGFPELLGLRGILPRSHPAPVSECGRRADIGHPHC